MEVRSQHFAEGAREAGLAAEQITRTCDAEEAVPALRALLQPDDVALIKGSRAMRMERIVTALSAGEAT